MSTEEQDLTSRTSPPTSMTPTMASQNPQTFPPSLETANTVVPPRVHENSPSNTNVNADTVQIGAEFERVDWSSSLSDIEDRATAESTAQSHFKSSPPPEEDDTEAETDRLEESPQKLRKHHNVVFSAVDNSSGAIVAAGYQRSNGSAEAFELEAATVKKASHIEINGPEDEAMDQTSEISSLEDSAEEKSRPASPTSVSGRKRKRSGHGTVVESDSFKVTSLNRAADGIVSNIASANARLELPELAPPIMKDDTMEDRVDGDDELSAEGGEEPSSLLHPVIYTRKKASRSGKKKGENRLENGGSRPVSPELEDVDANDANDAEESAAEEVEMEDILPGMEAGAAMRNEEEGMLFLVPHTT